MSDMTGPDHHAEMEAHYAAGRERDDERQLFDIAMAEAKARLAEEVERNGYPPNAELLIAWGVGAGVRTTFKLLMKEIGEAGAECSQLKIDASNHATQAEIARRERDAAERVAADRLQAVEDYRYGAREADRQIASLLGEVRRLTGPSEHMRHVKTHTYYSALAKGAEMQCAFPVSEGDKVTVYRGADGSLFVRPDAEFWDGVRFVPSDTPFTTA